LQPGAVGGSQGGLKRRESGKLIFSLFPRLCYGGIARGWSAEGRSRGGIGPARRWPPDRLSLRSVMIPTKPTIVELDRDALEEILRRVDAQELQADDYATIHALIESYLGLTLAVGDRNATIARLRKLLFGAQTEKTAAVVGGTTQPGGLASRSENALSDDPQASDAAICTQAPAGGAAEDGSAAAGQSKGHGRNGAEDYTGAEKVEVRHSSLTPGDACPQCDKGTVYDTRRPGVVVRLVGRSAVGAKVYSLQKLRCNLCGAVFTAEAPPGVGAEKNDATVGSMIALLKYGAGMPFHRAEKLQESLGIPLPASTQWDIVAAQAERAEPVFEELLRQAAQGDVVYNDDTGVKILEVMAERARRSALAEETGDGAWEGPAEACADENADSLAEKPEAKRTGTFTSGIVATGEGYKIALFLSGRQHAGENLKDVLARRAAELPPPIQMCDALSRNLPGELTTILANCLAHGRRQFVDVASRFPEECRHVLESLAVVYRNDALACRQNLSPDERLLFHQRQSGPIMENLHAWLARQLDERRVEPNSGLGKAIAYLLRHWKKLTLFLRVPGAPLDNNVCERALKRAILHRKNALFYKTCRGAHVGDLFMSLICTCEFCGANAFDYLTELERHADEARLNPQHWTPWNYRQAIAHASPSAR
jgi:transposase